MVSIAKYNYNVFFVGTNVDLYTTVNDLAKSGWEPVSVFTSETGILSLLARKENDN